MSEPMLLDDLQLEETDTIDEVESSDDSEFEVVEAPVNDEEPEQPEESPSVMECDAETYHLVVQISVNM